MRCYRCKSENKVKAGFIRELQRYKCEDYGCRFSVEKKSDVKSDQQKRIALDLYFEGMGFRAIGRYLGISHVTIYQWIKKWRSGATLPKNDEHVSVVELNEMSA